MTTSKQHCHIFTSESVSEGHPDKVADQISDAILDVCLRHDSHAHVACETMVSTDTVIVMGEVQYKGFCPPEGSRAKQFSLDTKAVAKGVLKRIGYDCPAEHFSYDTFQMMSCLHAQSLDIAQGVNRKAKEKQGAGDQGMMFGYATNETDSYMPAAIVYSHQLLKMFADLRKSDPKYAWLRPDAKSQLSVVYADGKPVAIDTVVISHQTTEAGATKENYAQIRRLAKDFLRKTGLLTAKTKFLVNPTGKFVIGGPLGDTGLTGRKIIVDTYGGMAAHGGGAFSGKDPSKVDRSAAYYARYAAKNIVAAGLADRCQIQVAYAIGVDRPVSFCVKTFGTAKNGATNAKLEAMLASGKVFDFRPYAIIRDLKLLKPTGWCYEDTAAYGHFGRPEFPWEKLDKVAKLKRLFKA